MLRRIVLLGLCFQVITLAHSQEKIKPRPSPTAIVTMKYENSYVKITYCQPHKKGRTIFGDLVPSGEVWRTGANEATELTTTKDLLVVGDTLKAGTYSLFSIPARDQWTMIFNEGLGQWGTYTYNDDLDVLRVSVESIQLQDVVWEPFTIFFEQKNAQAELILVWDTTKVIVPIQFLTENE